MVKTIHHRFEVTIAGEELSELEILWFYAAFENADFDFTISKSGRIMLFDGVKDIKELVKILADIGLADDIGCIKGITEYFPDYDTNNDEFNIYSIS